MTPDEMLQVHSWLIGGLIAIVTGQAVLLRMLARRYEWLRDRAGDDSR